MTEVSTLMANLSQQQRELLMLRLNKLHKEKAPAPRTQIPVLGGAGDSFARFGHPKRLSGISTSCSPEWRPTT